MATSDFDHRLIDVFKDASVKEVIFPFPNGEEGMKSANNLRQTFYRLRIAMRKEKHHLTSLADKVSVLVIMKGKDGKEVSFANKKTTPYPEGSFEVFMRLCPQGKKYNDLLEKAGYAIPPVPNLD